MLGAVIFDLDETLIHGRDSETHQTLDLHYLSWKSVLAAHSIDLNYKDFLESMRGQTNDECLRYLARAFGLSPLARLWREKEKYYRAEVVPKFLKWRDGAPELLRDLSASQVPIGVLTNAPRANVRAAEKALSVSRYVNPGNILTEADLQKLGLSPKPSPDGLRLFATRFNCHPSEMVFIGDSRYDVAAAKTAGVTSLGIHTPGNDEALRSQGVDHIFRSFRDLSIAQLSGMISSSGQHRHIVQ